MTETERTILTVTKISPDAKTRITIDVMALLDPAGGLGPIIPGILLSDVLDHLAHALHQAIPERDERDIRSDILRVMKAEDHLKEKDSARGGMEGGLLS